MSMAVGAQGGPKSDINMTPMIDVLLVLIIIFMVITPLTPKGLEALVPQPPPPNQQPSAADQRAQRLGQRLEEIFKTRAERVVFVRADPDLEYSAVAQAIDIAHGAQIDKVGLMPFKDLGQ
jgi:biopolymer transport protein ExbD